MGSPDRQPHYPAPYAPLTAPPVELRVHGVSGSPAEEMLDRPLIGQVAGDSEAGFFRPRSEYGGALGPGGARLEAYRWGNLTSGAAARAFWLLLLPFSLANAALWLRPPATGTPRRIIHGLTRVFALTVSLTFTVAAVGVFDDLLAWQCATPGSRCREERSSFTWVFSGFFEPAGRRLALAALGPILVVGLLWLLGRRTWARYESFELTTRNPDGDGLANPTFWDGRAQVGRLRGLHVAAMFATIAAVLLSVLVPHDKSTNSFAEINFNIGTPSAALTAGELVFGAVLGVLTACVLLLLVPAMVDRVAKSRAAEVLADSLAAASVMLMALTLAYAALPRAPWQTTGPLPGYAGLVTRFFAGQVALLVALALVVAALRHRAKGALFAGFGTPIIASLSLGLGVAMSAGVSYRIADYLDGSAVPSPAEFGARSSQATLAPPISYQWGALGFVLFVGVVLIALLWIGLVTLPLLRRRAAKATDADFPGSRRRDPARAKTIDTAIAQAQLTDRLTRVLGVASVLLGALGVVATVLAVRDIGPVELARSGSTAARWLSFLTNLGTYLVSLSIVALVLLGIQTYRNPRVRRTVGVIWDLVTFWPRSAHPLGPPCYAERVVPELVYRGTWLATEEGGLVLSGHSQGSVLAVAAVLQLPTAARRRTALLTYGAPVRRLYQKAFPNYFNDNVLAEVGAALAGPGGQQRWVNLWRRTDPIGGPVGRDDRRLGDPVEFDPPPGDRVAPAIAAHSGYQLTPEFGQAVRDLVGMVKQ